MPKPTPSPEARRLLAKRAACASTFNPSGRRVYLAATLATIGNSDLTTADRAFVVAKLTTLLIQSREAA